MRLTYIFHSGFAVETRSCILVFDYWMDPASTMPALLASGKSLYVFASHFHEDHFTREIFSWRKGGADVRYILSKDILRRHRASIGDADVWLAKGGAWRDRNLSVAAAGSNDSGVSWIVETEGRRIFHAGDLNNWYARFLTENGGGIKPECADMCQGVDPVREERLFLGELKDIRKIADRFDVVMFPVDGRIGNGYTRGGRQFIERFGVGLFVPMHFVASGFESAWRMKEFTDERGVDFWKIGREGECLDIK